MKFLKRLCDMRCTQSNEAIIQNNKITFKDESGYEYPYCAPPGFCESPRYDDKRGGYLTKVEVAPGSWMWGRDLEKEEENRESADKENKRRGALWTALLTRVLTEEEMQEVLKLGDAINEYYYVSYSSCGFTSVGSTIEEMNRQHQRAMQRMTAYYNQARLQLLAKGAKWPTSDPKSDT